MKPYTKPYLSVTEQISLLRSRRLLVTDGVRAAAALARIGYHRLSGYWYPFRTSSAGKPGEPASVGDNFRPGTEFGQVLDLYVFDKKLRILTLDAIERVEIALRTDIALLLGKRSPVAHRDARYLHSSFTKVRRGDHWTPGMARAPGRHDAAVA